MMDYFYFNLQMPQFLLQLFFFFFRVCILQVLDTTLNEKSPACLSIGHC